MVDSSTGMLTIKEVAAEFDRSIEQVRRYVREGRLPARKMGMQWFVDPGDVEEFRAGRRGGDSEEVARSGTVERPADGDLPPFLRRVVEIREEIRASGGLLNEDEFAELMDSTRRELL